MRSVEPVKTGYGEGRWLLRRWNEKAWRL